MKCITINGASNRRKSDKEIFVKIILVSSIIIGVGTNLNKRTPIASIKLPNAYNESNSEFDQVHIPNRSSVIAKMISVLRPEFSLAKRNDVASKIHHALTKYNIEPQIVLAIIDTESNFNHELVSSTGDLSMAQVNVEVWNKEFERMNLHLIKTDKLKSDQTYSLEVMAQILNILKTRYEKKDRKWYARYHSKTKKHKSAYLSKINARLKLLHNSNVVALH